MAEHSGSSVDAMHPEHGPLVAVRRPDGEADQRRVAREPTKGEGDKEKKR